MSKFDNLKIAYCHLMNSQHFSLYFEKLLGLSSTVYLDREGQAVDYLD